jgi:tetratricopeptide (TPR) repeat protein
VLLDLRLKENQDFLASLADRVQRITRVEPPSLGFLPDGEKSVAFLKYLASAGSFWLTLDNAEEFLDARRPEFLAFLKDFCRLGHSSRIVLLSRSAWTAAQNPPLHMALTEIRDALRKGIPEEDAMALFRQCFSSGEGSRFALLPDSLVRRIVMRLHRMPMAIEQFAGYLNARAAEFPEGGGFEREIRNSNLLRLFNPENPEAFLLGVIRAHVEHLSEREQLLLTVVAWAGMPVPKSGLSAVDRAFHPDAATSVLTQLANSGLLERTAGTTAEGIAFGMHAIVREAIGDHAPPDLATVVSALMEAGYAELTAREHRPALALYTLGVLGLRRLVEEESRRELENVLAGALMNGGNALSGLQRLLEAVKDHDAAIAILRRLVEEEDRRELENDLAAALINRGVALLRLQRLPEAVEDYDAAIAILRRLVEEENSRELENDLAAALMNRGIALRRLQRLPEAVEDYDAAIAIRRRLVEEENRRELESDLSAALMNRGTALSNLQRLPEAVTDYDAAIAILRRLVEEENRRELESDLAAALMNRGNALWGLQRLPEAVTDHDGAIAILRRLVEEENRRELENDLAAALMNRGTALRRLQRLPEAVEDYDAAIAIRQRLVEEENRRELESDLAAALMNRGTALSDLQRLPAAVEDYDAAIAILWRLVEEENRRELESGLAMACYNAALAFDRLDDHGRACDRVREALRLWKELVDAGMDHLEGDLADAQALVTRLGCLK